MKSTTLSERFRALRVLVVGDLVLDEYLIGQVDRLSREAPVPVLEQTRVVYVAGGAANPAVNICSLGARGMLAGVLGADDAAIHLQTLLQERGVDPQGIVVDAQRPTTQKTRIVAEGAYVFAHHLARVDHLSRAPIAAPIETALQQNIARLMPQVDAVLVSDYRLGVVTPGVARSILHSARQHHVFASVDSQGNLDAFAHFDLLRCNAQEAMTWLQRPLRSDADFARGAQEMATTLAVGAAIITRGAAGVTGFSPQQGVFHLPASNRTQVFDVTGAGDTFIAVTTLARAAGLSLQTAADLGNRAAGVAVTQLGNVAVTMADLNAGP